MATYYSLHKDKLESLKMKIEKISLDKRKYRYVSSFLDINFKEWLSIMAILGHERKRNKSLKSIPINQTEHIKPKRKEFEYKDYGNNLKQTKYKNYLGSTYWKEMKDYINLKYDYQCVICFSSRKLHLHHKSYKHKGNFELEKKDIILVCKACHNYIHENNRLNKSIETNSK